MNERSSVVIAIGVCRTQVLRFVRTKVGTFRLVKATTHATKMAARVAANRWERPWLDQALGKQR